MNTMTPSLQTTTPRKYHSRATNNVHTRQITAGNQIRYYQTVVCKGRYKLLHVPLTCSLHCAKTDYKTAPYTQIHYILLLAITHH